MANRKADEDDLDDLDDILGEFNAPSITKPSAPPPKPAKAGPLPPTAPQLPDEIPDDFAQELAAGMESLMRELNTASGSSSNPSDAALKEAWEKLLEEDMNGAAPEGLGELFAGISTQGTEVKGKGKTKTKTKDGAQEPEDPFQARIRQAMDKLRDSDDTLKADSASAASDPFAALFSSLGDLNLGEGEGEGGGDLQDMLETMMSQLMSKEILYEPLKELNEKFPEYLQENKSTLSTEDFSRYSSQQTLVSQIIAIFQSPSYSDDNTEQSTQILKLMNEMQSFGSPPPAIMGALPPGFDLGPDGMPKMPDNCVVM